MDSYRSSKGKAMDNSANLARDTGCPVLSCLWQISVSEKVLCVNTIKTI